MLAGGSPRRARRALSACGADCSRKGALVTALDEPSPGPQRRRRRLRGYVAPPARLSFRSHHLFAVDRDNLFRMQETDRQRSA